MTHWQPGDLALFDQRAMKILASCSGPGRITNLPPLCLDMSQTDTVLPASLGATFRRLEAGRLASSRRVGPSSPCFWWWLGRSDTEAERRQAVKDMGVREDA